MLADVASSIVAGTHGSRRSQGPGTDGGLRAGRVSRLLYAAAGAVLGVGAPAGALILRVLSGANAPDDLRRFGFFYLYELVGTCLVFAAAGFAAGRRADLLRRGRDRFQELSEKDALTGLLNVETFRRHYERAAAHAATATRAHGEPLALLVMDVDGLKEINDSDGHSVGSAVLLHAARALEQSKRISDVAARWGGDEFALLMPGAGAEAASRLSEQILERVRQEPVRPHGAGAPGLGDDRNCGQRRGAARRSLRRRRPRPLRGEEGGQGARRDRGLTVMAVPDSDSGTGLVVRPVPVYPGGSRAAKST